MRLGKIYTHKSGTWAFKLARSSGVVQSRVSLIKSPLILDQISKSYFDANSGFKFVSPSRFAVITKHFPLLLTFIRSQP